MSERAATPLAPSTKLGLYLAAVIGIYFIRDPVASMALGATYCTTMLAFAIARGRLIPRGRWRAVIVFAAWVFIMRVGLDLVSGGTIQDGVTLQLAGRQVARVLVLAIGVLCLVSLTPARDVVDELETTRLPRAVRLLVMMVVQYPRVLRDRYEQIVEAQIARGADRARSIRQRATHGTRLLLPVMQSELNAIGDRASLMHLRRLDVETPGSHDAMLASTEPLTFSRYGFSYGTDNTNAVTDLNLSLPRGRVTAVIAPQGRGKTTLLRAAAGLLGDIYQGQVTGSVAPTHDAAAFFDGYVQVTLAVETVREELALPLYASGMIRDERHARVEVVARELNIERLLDRNVTQLSGGEEKLVGIASALAPDVAIHILDEPFEQLDVSHFAAVIRAVKNRARAGRLVLVATSSIDVALNIADNAVVFDGSTWRLIDRPTYADLAAIPSMGRSPVASFLDEHHASDAGVRRFRDAVRQIA